MVGIATLALTAKILTGQPLDGLSSVEITEYGSFALAQGITAGQTGRSGSPIVPPAKSAGSPCRD